MPRLKWSLGGMASIGFALAILTLVLIGVVSYRETTGSIKDVQVVAHANEILDHLTDLLVNLTDAEAGLRGCVLTRDESFLEPYESALPRVEPLVRHLKELTADDPTQQRRLNMLIPLIQAKFNIMGRSVSLAKAGRFEDVAVAIAARDGKNITDSVRRIIAEMEQEEETLLVQRQEAAATSAQRTTAVIVRNTLIGFVFITLALLLVNHEATQHKRADEVQARLIATLEATPDFVGFADAKTARVRFINKAGRKMVGLEEQEDVSKFTIPDFHSQWTNERLFKESLPAAARDGLWIGECAFLSRDGREVPVLMVIVAHKSPSGEVEVFSTISRDISGLKKTEAEVRRLNEELEARVVQRTAELEAANKELEAFCYSVSHDLRAPLRAIDGFSAILAKEHGPQLSAQAQQLFQVVRDNIKKMAQLIDDLLNLSRLGRQPLKKEMVATVVIVSRALEELRAEQNGHPGEVIVGDLPPCDADPALLKQVYVNLLSNALKYSRQREGARIEVGCRESVYFVRDNGAGFDMQYAHKLFGVFQRLHRAEDYEGTGVGLAIVQRIIRRHGGRVWAEGEVGKGATFFFTLDGEQSSGWGSVQE